MSRTATRLRPVPARVPAAAVRRLPTRVLAAAAIEKLPERSRLVLSLRLLEGLTPLETAGALRTTVSVIEREYVDALRTIAASLGSGRPNARSRRSRKVA